MQVSDNKSNNETFGEERDITPIARISVGSKSVRFGRKELFSNAKNAENLPTNALSI